MLMFLVDLNRPYRPVQPVDCEVKVCAKTSWAEVRGRRYLVGASAFHTPAQAVIKRYTVLRSIIADRTAPIFRPHLLEAAKLVMSGRRG